jgi:hypothetical protein
MMRSSLRLRVSISRVLRSISSARFFMLDSYLAMAASLSDSSDSSSDCASDSCEL